MMIRYSLLLLIGVVTATPARACDACGCSTMIWQASLLPYNNTHQLGWSSQWVRYHSFHSLNDRQNKLLGSQESYYQIAFNAHIQIQERWVLQLNVPYRLLRRKLATSEWRAAGWGDPTIMLNYTVWQNKKSDWQQQLQLGLGSSLPLGQQAIDNEQAVEQANFRLGTGSIGLLTQANHLLRFKRLGWRNRLTYRHNGTNSEAYRYGHAWQGESIFFAIFSKGKSGFTPQIGYNYERTGQDVQRNFYRNDTGGHFSFGQLGLQWLHPQFNVLAQCQLPIQQDWANGLTVAQTRINLQLNFLINKNQ